MKAVFPAPLFPKIVTFKRVTMRQKQYHIVNDHKMSILMRCHMTTFDKNEKLTIFADVIKF